MELSGKSIIGFARSENSTGILHGIHAATGEKLDPPYYSASEPELERAVQLAAEAFASYRASSRESRARFLRQIAGNLDELGDQLVERTMAESALPEGRVRGERDRTCFQLRFFAGLIEEGSWVDARIDSGDANRKPAPKPDVRSMLRPLGPVAVFCASNFPLAFSVAGGDTASALAGGNPVIVNAHFSHPGTAELCGMAIRDAAAETRMPEGVFSLLFSGGQEIGQRLLAHPGIKACGFTGSRRGGMALLKIAQSRGEPIPFFAEMSSVNPVFVLPHALEERGEQLGAGLHASITLGVGQFCTNPGIALLPRGESGDRLVGVVAEKMQGAQPAAMLNAGILENYSQAVLARSGDPRIRALACSKTQTPGALPALFEVDAGTFSKTPELAEEVFGPASLVVRYGSEEEILSIARSLEGNLTATIHAGAGDEELEEQLLAILETKAGRVLFAGFPTGVEVCQAMVHGGPFPATSDGRSTSVGGRAIERFVRPVCYQDAPAHLLPEELRSENPAGILRIVNGERSRRALP
jgi:NADP-dependent aldehyde dehydrogenase